MLQFATGFTGRWDYRRLIRRWLVRFHLSRPLELRVCVHFVYASKCMLGYGTPVSTMQLATGPPVIDSPLQAQADHVSQRIFFRPLGF